MDTGMILYVVIFSCSMEDYEDECPGIPNGSLCVWAKDIFEALDIAQNKIKSFGFDKYIIYGVTRKEKME